MTTTTNANPLQDAGHDADQHAGRVLPLHALLGFLFPGAGQMARGELQRGLYAAAGVLSLFLGGLLLGGIDAVDSREDRIWYFGQVLVGPIAIATDRFHQAALKAEDPTTGQIRSANPDEVRDTTGPRPVWRPMTDAQRAAGARPPSSKSVGRVNELAMLSCTLAGMLNLIIILDALVPHRWSRQP
jgi:hypothetical protein